MTMLPPDPVFVTSARMTSVLCICISYKKDYVYCGTQQGTVHIWSLETMRQVDTFSNGKESCLSISLSCDGALFVQDKAGCIRRWSKVDGSWITSTEVQINYMGFCPIRLVDDFIISPISSLKLQVNSLQSGECIKTIDVSNSETVGEVMSLVTFKHLEQNCILVASESGTISAWDRDSSKLLGPTLKLEECPMAMDFDEEKMRGIIGSPSSTVTVFQLASDFSLKIYRQVKIINEGVASISIRPDKRLVAMGCWDGKIRLISWKTFVTLAVLDVHSETVNTVAFSAKSPYLMIAGCKSGRLSIWDIYNVKR